MHFCIQLILTVSGKNVEGFCFINIFSELFQLFGPRDLKVQNKFIFINKSKG